jgi:hypothetical protein
VVTAGLRGTPAALVTRSLANVLDLLVALLVVAATRFLLLPATFTFPAPVARTLLLVGLGVQVC